MNDLECGLGERIIVSGAAVHSQQNEADLMALWLRERGVSPDRIVREREARHTTSNLRNAGRIVLEHGADRALIVTSDGDWLPRRRPRFSWRFAEQSYYVGFPWLSTFHLRCLLEFGHAVGELRWISPMHVEFRPSPRCLDH